MTLDDLKRRLRDAGVHRGSYDFDRTNRDEVYCLEKSAEGWVSYYRERGVHRDERLFTSEGEAAEVFLAAVLGDPTTRLPR